MSAADDIRFGRGGGRRLPKGHDPSTWRADLDRILGRDIEPTVPTGCDSDEQLALFDEAS